MASLDSPENRAPSHDILGEGDGVLAEVVVDEGEAHTVARAVDLHDEPEIEPAHVEVDPTGVCMNHELAVRLRQATTAAHAGEVQLTE